MRRLIFLAAIAAAIAAAQPVKQDQGFTSSPGAPYDFSLSNALNLGHLLTTGDLSFLSLQGTNSAINAAESMCMSVGNGGQCITIAMPPSLTSAATLTLPSVSTGILNVQNQAYCIGTVPTTNTTTYFLTPGAQGGGACNAAGNNVGTGNPMPFACTGKNLFVVLGTTPSASTTDTFNLQKNGSNSGVTCTITNPATTCSDTTHTIAFAAGDTWLLDGITGAATDATAQVRMSFQCQ